MAEKLEIGNCNPCVYQIESVDDDGIQNLKCKTCGGGRRIDDRFILTPEGLIENVVEV